MTAKLGGKGPTAKTGPLLSSCSFVESFACNMIMDEGRKSKKAEKYSFTIVLTTCSSPLFSPLAMSLGIFSGASLEKVAR